jgi:hypothetical protein
MNRAACVRLTLALVLLPQLAGLVRAALPGVVLDYTDRYCSSCHNDEDKKGRLDLASLAPDLASKPDLETWVKIHDRLTAGEMPPEEKPRPDAGETAAFLQALRATLLEHEGERVRRDGRATQRRLNGYEYENALRDLLSPPGCRCAASSRRRRGAPLQQDRRRPRCVARAPGALHRGGGLCDPAGDLRAAGAPPTTTTRHYARDQRTLTSKFTPNPFNSSPDRMTYPVLGTTPQPDVRMLEAPLTVGDSDPATREQEAVGWVSSNYVTGFTYRWDGFRAPGGRPLSHPLQRLHALGGAGGVTRSFSHGEKTRWARSGRPTRHAGLRSDFPGRTEEPITVYTRNGVMNRRVGSFDLTPEPAVHDLGEVWLLANETLVPDASRFYRSRPSNFRNPLMTSEGAPSVAFRWMEVEGPLYDESTAAGYRLLFGDLPAASEPPRQPSLNVPVVARGDRREGGRNAGQRVDPLVETRSTSSPKHPRTRRRAPAARLRRPRLSPARGRSDVERFLSLVRRAPRRRPRLRRSHGRRLHRDPGLARVRLSRRKAGAARRPRARHPPRAVSVELAPRRRPARPRRPRRARRPGSSAPRPSACSPTRARSVFAMPFSITGSTCGKWRTPRRRPRSTTTTTSTTRWPKPRSPRPSSGFDRAAPPRPAGPQHLIDGLHLPERAPRQPLRHSRGPGVALRRVALPPDSPRGGVLTQASVLKVTANGTTTSPVLRGKWIVRTHPRPRHSPAAARRRRRTRHPRRGHHPQQLAKHRADPSCASCHDKMDPPGFALENFDVMGGWRDRYRGVDETKTPERASGKNGQPFAFHFGLPVDAAGELPDGRPFTDVREFKRLLLENEPLFARNLPYATGAPVTFSDRMELDRIIEHTAPSRHGVRSLIHAIVQSDLFRHK